MKKIIISIGIIVVILIVAVLLIIPSFIRRTEQRRAIQQAEILLDRELPSPYSPIFSFDSEIVNSASINLPVPFTSQAPHGNWNMPYQEACEEAAALMAIRYVFGNPILHSEDADAGIKDLVRTNEEILGYPVDQTAEQIKDLILEIDPEIPVKLLHDPTISILKENLAFGYVIIVPSAGRKLNNPFYHQPGPVYHMLVIRGFTDDGYFITNDPGTKRGEEYIYSQEVIMDAMGDWNNGQPEMGDKVVLVLQPILSEWGEDYSSPL